eukprot:10333119-Ditylum_brightwellii.AAC.1
MPCSASVSKRLQEAAAFLSMVWKAGGAMSSCVSCLDNFGGHLRFGVGGGVLLDLVVILGDGGTTGGWVVVFVLVAVVLAVVGI